MDHRDSKNCVETLKLKEQRIVGMYCGYFHVQVLVEHENGERQIVGWGFDSE